MALTDDEREQLLEDYKDALPAFPEDNNVYVSTRGDDSLGDGSPEAPFATIGKALRGLDPAEQIDLWIENEGILRDDAGEPVLDDDGAPIPVTLQFEYERAAHLPRLYMHTWIR